MALSFVVPSWGRRNEKPMGHIALRSLPSEGIHGQPQTWGQLGDRELKSQWHQGLHDGLWFPELMDKLLHLGYT